METGNNNKEKACDCLFPCQVLGDSLFRDLLVWALIKRPLLIAGI